MSESKNPSNPDEQKNLEDRESHDWRDPSRPRNPEDDVVGYGGWKRRADGRWERVQSPSAENEETPGESDA